MTRQLSPLVGQAFFSAFSELLPAQKAAIPPILAGDDVLIRSATASGKTEAAVAPLIDQFLQDMRDAQGVTIVVISPTRALVNDLARRLEVPLSELGVRVGVRHGERDQLDVVNKPDVLLTTPESFDILISTRHQGLEAVRAVIVDEAHLLFNTQRGLQVGLTLRRLEMWLQRQVQTVGLSATIGDAGEVWKFFRPGREIVDVHVPGGRPLHRKIRLGVTTLDLVNIIGRYEDSKLLVFVNSRRECERVVDQVRQKSKDPSRIFAHHSSLSKEQRSRTEAAFSEISRGVCVATPTLELGIDIGSIDLVILYGIPPNWQSLAQRVGRGNRRRSEIEALLCVPTHWAEPTTLSERLAFQALLAEAFQEQSARVRSQELVGALAQQFCSELDARGGFVGVNPLAKIAEPWGHLDWDTSIQVLDALVDADIIQQHPAYNRYGPAEGLHELRERWQVWSNFVGGGQSIDVSNAGRHLGQISTQNLSALQIGDVFLLGGLRWRIDRFSPQCIYVSPTQSRPNRVMKQDGGPPSESQTTAEWIRRVIRDAKEADDVLPRTQAESLTAEVEPIRSAIRDEATPLLRSESGFHYLTFAGPLINGVLAARFGNTRLTNAVVLTTSEPIDTSHIPETIEELLKDVMTPPRERSLFQNILPDNLLDAEEHSSLLSDPLLQTILDRVRSSAVAEVSSNHLVTAFGISLR